MNHRRMTFLVIFCFSTWFAGYSWAQHAAFEIIIFDGGPDAKVIDSDGNMLGTLTTQVPGWGGYPSSLSDDRSRLLYVAWPAGSGAGVWLYDVKMKETRKVTDAPWCQTLKWLPQSSSKFVYAVNGQLYLYDLDAESSVLWQDNNTTPYGAYREGIDWDAQLDKVVFQAGYGGAGGDAVFIGHYSETYPLHHIVDIQFLANPGNGSSSWANVAFYPVITSDGNTVYYGLRKNPYHALIRKDLTTGGEQVLMENEAGSPAGYILPFFLYRDTQMIVYAPSQTVRGSYALSVCSTDPFACREVYTAADIRSAIAVDNLLHPIASAGGPYAVREGEIIALTPSGQDPEGGSLVFAWDIDGDGTFETLGQNVSFKGSDGPGTPVVGVQVTSQRGISTIASAVVTVQNAAPVVGPITAPVDPALIGSPVLAKADFTDAGELDTHSATWSWGDGSSSSGTVTETRGSGTASGSHLYASPGVYSIALTIIDKDGDSGHSIFEYVVVFDPGAGFVTGGGWIDTPAGSFPQNPALGGKATFGFVSKYLKGAKVPTGNTQFNFHVAGMEFKSTVYEWLVVAGAKAQFKGEGNINGAGVCGFLLTAIDGQINGGGGMDKFRIKIWDKATGQILYDNKMGEGDSSDAATATSGGSIVIHYK